MFFGAATDTQCAAFRATPRFADPDSVSHGQQCGLLQPGPSRCVWPAPRPAAVSSQHRRSTYLLGEEVRTHNPSALRTPLVASSREDTIPIVCSGVSLSSRHCAIIPRRDASPNHRRRWSLPPAFCRHIHVTCSIHPSVVTRRSCVSSGGLTCMEQPTGRRQRCTVPCDLPTAFRDVFVPLFIWLTLTASL